MSDTANGDLKLASATNVTISNAATFDNTQTVSADCVLVLHKDGRIEFTDKLGNKVKSRQRDLRKLFDRLNKEQTTADDYSDKPTVA